MSAPSPCHQDIVESCGVVEGKILQKARVGGGGGIGGRQIPTKDNGAPSLPSLR